jgi:hypothetical protein
VELIANRVQVPPALKPPPETLAVQVTVPVGAVVVPGLLSFTVIVKFTEPPRITLEELAETLLLVPRLLIVRVDVPLLET